MDGDKNNKTRRVISTEEREDAYARAEAELFKNWTNKSTPAANALMGMEVKEGETGVKPNEFTIQELQQQFDNVVTRIREISYYRKGVRGTTQKTLHEIATLAKHAFKEISERSSNKEVRRQQSANSKLKREINLLKHELAELKR